MKLRFGGAAGPISFEHMRRMHNGRWDTVTVPMGLALRTSALLEPHASPSCVLVEERFHQFGGGRADRADELSPRFMKPVSQEDLADLEFDRNDQRFVLRKNLLDPPYPTKLWKITLA